MTDTTSVLGYVTPLVVKPGGRVSFHLSSETLSEIDLDVVRVRCGDPAPGSPGLRLHEMDSPANGRVAVRHQPLRPGSYGRVPDGPALALDGSFAIGGFVWPTLPGNGRDQTIMAHRRDDAGWSLGLDPEGRPVFRLGSASVVTDRPLLGREWVFVAASFDAGAERISLAVASLDAAGGRDRSAEVEGAAAPSRAPAGTPLTIGGLEEPDGGCARPFNGKVDRPRILRGDLRAEAVRAACETIEPDPAHPALVAAWDFSRGIGGDRIHDLSANRLDGRLLQMPTRGVTGANWDGSATAWPMKPAQYAAVHFHEDDMLDAGWEPDGTVDIPAEWPSGFYALRLRGRTAAGEEVESFASFFVGAELGRPRAKLAFVASTATFLAYANSALRLDQVHAETMLEGLIQLSRDDVYLQEHRELGLSTYDTHSDESGWMLSTALRPILNMRPRGNTFNYVNDTYFIDWLEEKGFAYDIVTDDDIHRDGAALLKQYDCVVTGSHPEYVSREMWDAFDAFQRAGGRHMYLGGNGFYWRIAFHPTLPSTIEVRREDTGLRTWEGEAGEGHHAFTGERAGLWRSNGRPPQRLVGVGFDAQVFDFSSYYRQLPAARDPRAAFVFEGIGPDERIGDFGLRNGGAAGLEIDRADATLGSAPDLLLLATADRIGTGGLPTPEEFRTYHRGLEGDQNARVRADMTFSTTQNGGAVFTTGSIAWVCSLSHAGYDNNVSRVTENVLRRFLDPAPF